VKKADRKRGTVAPPFTNVEIRESRAGCRMRRLPDEQIELLEEAEPGAFCYVTAIAPSGEDYRAMRLKLPEGSIVSIALNPLPPSAVIAHTQEDGRIHAWSLRGTLDRPTIVPSLWLRGPWYGYAKDGELLAL